jgi:hypothetical protein
MAIVVDSLNSVNAEGPYWRLDAWVLAKAQRQFEITGFREDCYDYALKLGTTFGYRIKHCGTKIVFIPRVARG